MTVVEAARLIGVSKSLVYRLIEEGRLSHIRVGQRGRRGKILLREPDVEAFLKGCRKEAED